MKDKVVIITGASSGIGKALAIEYASKGSKLVLAARRIEQLNEIKKNLKVPTLCVKTDVCIEKDCENLIEQAIHEFGKIDILINNAGISMRALFEDLELQVMHDVMNVNFWGTVYCTKFALPHLLKSKGSIVGVISIAGHVGLPARTAYAASKFAVRGFLDTIRIENLYNGLHVLVAAPAFVASDIRKHALVADGSTQGETPREEKEMMTSEEVASKIYNAVVKRKSQLIFEFTEGKLTVFLGKFLPRLLDKLIYNFMAKEPDSPLKKIK